ncbi:hypothetical protein [Pseudanabaena sp. 'Roaring Creek']|uniref:hypothetical protein n=1 Tax=Pseudanabaena sp. 'Roaring Creek' TaxID=1681830 RepID=UPI0006D7A7D3|nr:hypothetical protein [Pseudanabaena sp. 'Roaring Creek']
MANETRGILFETIAEVALRKAVVIAGIAGEVRWNQKPEGMSIIPDFTIGVDNTCLSHVVLITASGSAKETDKKFWRNMGELYEVKSQIQGIPSVISVYFKSVVKKGLDEVTEMICDANLHIEERFYARVLTDWVQVHLGIAGKTREEKQLLLSHGMNSNPQLAESVESLAQDLATALGQKNRELEPLWILMREDYVKPHHPPTAKTTTLRRGLGKLLVLEPILRQMVYAGYTKTTGIPSQHLPEYVFDLGFFKKTLGGGKLTDDEMKGAIDLLGAEACEAVLQKAPDSMNTWISPLRDLDRVDTHVDFVYQHYNKVTDPKELERLLIQCFNDPAGLSGAVNDEKVWIFEIMVSLLKAKSGKLQGYGLAQLAEDTGLVETGEGAPLARFIIPKFSQRQEMLETEHLKMLAQGLAKRFKQNIAYADIPALKLKVEDWVIKENLEDRLIPYRNFEPLLWLLETELDKQSKPYAKKIPYEGWVNEYANVGKKSATTPFVKVGTTLIHWKSSYASHPNDKTKELSARARSIKYQYHPTTKTFSRRQGVDRLALIVDGDWKDNHLQTLANSGWDIIVYPDDIDKLVNSL